jgi:hypothetical protein
MRRRQAMSHNNQNSRRWVLAVAALAVTMAFVAAAPAAAKAPAPYPLGCPKSEARDSVPEPVRAACERVWAAQQTAGDRSGSDTSGAIVAGSLAVLVFAMAGGLLVTTHRREAQARHAAALSGAAPN